MVGLTIIDDVYRALLKGLRNAGAHTTDIENILNNPAARQNFENLLKLNPNSSIVTASGKSAFDDALDTLRSSSGLDNTTRGALGQPGLRDLLRRAAASINQHPGVISNLATQLESGALRSGDDILDFLRRSGVNEADDMFQAFKQGAPHLAQNATQITARQGVLGRLQGAGSAVRDATVTTGRVLGKTYDIIKQGFTAPRYALETSQGLKYLSRAEVASYRASGELSKLRQVQQFSRLRTGLTVAGVLGVNSVTDGLVSDGAVELVSSARSPIAWIVRKVGDGSQEAFYSVSGDFAPDVSEPEWLAEVEDYDPERDGMLLMVSGEQELATPEQYRERYAALTGEEHTDMSSIMTPEVYARKYPSLLAAKQAYDQRVRADLGITDPNNPGNSGTTPGTTPGTTTNPGGQTGTGIDWDNLRGGSLSHAFDTASQALERGQLQLGFQDRMMFGIVSTLADMFNAINFGGWANGLISSFQKFAVNLAKDEIETQFGDRFPDMVAQRMNTPAPTTAPATQPG